MIDSGQIPVGLVDVQTYAPNDFMTAADIAGASGIEEAVIRDKFGLEGKHVSAPDEHVTDMCIAAAKPLLERNNPADVDAVIYFGSHFKDYQVWQAAPAIQRALGIEGYSLELINVSAGAPIALKVVADMLRSDPHLGSVLLVAASKEAHLLDYTNPRARFMNNFGDGAVAALLRRDKAASQVLSSSIITDGSFSEHVGVFGGGSKHPASSQTVASGMHHLDVAEGEEMKRRLDPIAIKNFIEVTRESLDRSGRTVEDIDFLFPIHFKRSLHEAILLELGLTNEQTIYLDHYGHMSAVDPLFGLALAREQGLLFDGALVVLLAAGTGYSWAATSLEWQIDSNESQRPNR